VFKLQLYSLGGTHFDDEVFEAIVPTTEGDIAINGGHAPLVGVISAGIITIKKKKSDKSDKHEHLAIFSGAIEVLNNLVRVLVDEAEDKEGVVENEAKKAIERAQKLKQNARDDVSLAEAEALIDRQQVRLRLAELKKHSRKRY
jgi:F-type H+-transporting ATPase subunit epsilon